MKGALIRLLERLPDLLKGSSVYAVALAIESLVPILLLVLLTRFVSPEEYGVWSLFVALVTFLRPVIGLTLQDSIRVKFFDLKQHELKRYVGAIVQLTTMLSGLTLVICVFFSDLISRLTKFPGEWLWLVVFMAYLYNLFQNGLAILQFEGRRGPFLKTEIVYTVVTVAICGIILVFYPDWRGAAVGRIIALALILIILFGLTLRISLHDVFSKRDSRTFGNLLAFGLRYLPAGMEMVVVPLMDRLVVAHGENLAEAGFLSIGALFGTAVRLFSLSFFLAWQPILFRQTREAVINSARFWRNPSTVYLTILPFGGLCVVVVGNFALPYLVTGDFEAAAPYILWFTMVAVVQGFFQHNQTHLHSRNLISAMALSSLLVIALNGFFNFLWLDSYGGKGVAWATGVAYLLGTVFNAVLVFRYTNKRA